LVPIIATLTFFKGSSPFLGYLDFRVWDIPRSEMDELIQR
jgi:hypothetical protein